jgi:hypothetical protein
MLTEKTYLILVIIKENNTERSDTSGELMKLKILPSKRTTILSKLEG